MGLAYREVTILAADLEGFLALAYDQAITRTAFMLEHWTQLFSQSIMANDGHLVRREAALMIAVFGYPEKGEDHHVRAVKALRRLHEAVRDFNRTHGSRQAFTAGIESGKAFVGSGASNGTTTCFGRVVDTVVRLCGARHCGVGLVGPKASASLVSTIPLEPLIGVAEDLGSAARIAPAFFDKG